MSSSNSAVPTPRPIRSPRLARTFARLATEGRKAFIPYVTAGDPDLATSAAVLLALAEGGADIIELGVPFSDPMADGEVIQAAMLRALGGGTTFAKVLDLVREFRAKDTRDTPIVLFGYLNPIYRVGLAQAAKAAREAGADAFLVVDLPPEEAAQLTDPLTEEGLDFVALFTPTSADERVRAIASQASGFAYYVSMAGITGDALTGLDEVAQRTQRVREVTGLPVAVGFGIRSGDDARRVATFADAVVIGSHLIQTLATVAPAEQPAVARAFAAEIRAALDGQPS
ncbi:MAG: tryptophan synthase subunit alpha [Deltaproteobacteria bacterium]|nr:tryptophan synthase subunit alpha [Deltaproteobacteria bacterium]